MKKKIVKKKVKVNYKKVLKETQEALFKLGVELAIKDSQIKGKDYGIIFRDARIKTLEEKLANLDKTSSEYYELNKAYRKVLADMTIENDDEHCAEIRELNQKNKYTEAAKEAFYGRSPMTDLLNSQVHSTGRAFDMKVMDSIINPPLIMTATEVKERMGKN